MIEPSRRYWCPVCSDFVRFVEEDSHEVVLATGVRAVGGDVLCATCGYIVTAFVIAES
jgi:hypothetical protein